MADRSTKRYQLAFSGGETVFVQIMPMKGSYHIYLTSPEMGSAMQNLVCAIQTPYDPMPSATSLVSSEDVQADSWATSIGQKLAKKLKVQMLVSCNLPATYESIFPHLELELLKLLSSVLERDTA
jgi:hypothetical protein